MQSLRPGDRMSTTVASGILPLAPSARSHRKRVRWGRIARRVSLRRRDPRRFVSGRGQRPLEDATASQRRQRLVRELRHHRAGLGSAARLRERVLDPPWPGSPGRSEHSRPRPVRGVVPDPRPCRRRRIARRPAAPQLSRDTLARERVHDARTAQARSRGATPEVVAALPPIAGFADPPLLDGGPRTLPLTDATTTCGPSSRGRRRGARARGLDPHHPLGGRLPRLRPVALPPAAMARRRAREWTWTGRHSYGSHPLATGVRGSFGATVHPFDLRQPRGWRFRERLDERTAAAARTSPRRCACSRPGEASPYPMRGPLRLPRRPGPRKTRRWDARPNRREGLRD